MELPLQWSPCGICGQPRHPKGTRKVDIQEIQTIQDGNGIHASTSLWDPQGHVQLRLQCTRSRYYFRH